MRPARALINLKALHHNYHYAKSLAPHSKAAAIIKANAYGHGAIVVARALHDADAFGVACIEEALELREAGITQPIVLLEGVFTPDELPLAARYQLMVAVHCVEQVIWLEQAKLIQPLAVWLKIDTGMHRLGFAPEQVASIYARLNACSHVATITLMTHFARADEVECEATTRQIERFNKAIQGIDAPLSIANSPAILAWPKARLDWVRPGIMLYGATPIAEDLAVSQELQPVMTLESALISVRELDVGESIGYGARFTCEQPTRVGVVAMGYADGYPRHAVDGTPVAVNGVRTRIIGRVSMDMLTVDLTPLPQAKVGDRVELWGNMVLANEVAAHSQTIAYTLFTGITRRVPLVYQY
ncbi:MAG: alanine racemase [Thiofilum sp.]|uniref:alanine racemase n=1 Tax=Thiofilum sp. TaxID=2212733 RepID=UPI0025DDD11E|nr:alanine racemase [Thiofilum sp.]MBK8452340.1 alanine racemase [Thiofilum sp.]